MDAPPPLRILTAFTLSLAINAAFFYSLDHSPGLMGQGPGQTLLQKKIAARGDDKFEFEFIEAPPKIRPVPPKPTKKIAAWDSVSQDAGSKRSENAPAPDIKTMGLSDQLAQRRGAAPVLPQPMTEPAPPRSDPEQAADSKPGETQDTMIIEKEEKPQAPAPPPSALIKAADGVPGLTGRDKINTQETARAASPGARFFGITSFEATGSGMGVYMKNLKERIWLAWYPYMVFKYPKDFKTADAVVSFTLNKAGQVKIVRVIDSEGSELFATFCVDSVQRASNFGPLPEEILALLGKDELEIRFGFHYR